MAIHTDAPDFLRALYPPGAAPPRAGTAEPDDALRPLLAAFYGERPSVASVPLQYGTWRHLLVSGHTEGSQYDRLVRLIRAGVALPDGVACIARTGTGLQGFRGRGWFAGAGNVHLTVHLAPGRAIPRFETVFTALAAVSVVEAVDGLAALDGRARIKWVNDVLVGDAKVAGVLAYTQTRGAAVTSVVLGIGVNVETTPVVAPTAFVPGAAALRDLAPSPAEPRQRDVLWPLLRALERNYRTLLADGYRPIMDAYRARSAVLGEEVFVSFDDPGEVPRRLAAGRVHAIGDGLELFLEGRAQPVTRGRLVLAPAAVAELRRAQPADPPSAPHPLTP